MNQNWITYVTSQWWLFALIGVAGVLAWLIRGQSDDEALKTLSKKLWGVVATGVAWYAFQFIGTQPFYGLGVGAGATFAVLSLLLPNSLKEAVVRSENFGRLTIAVLIVGVFVFFVMPTLTPSQLSNLLLGVVVIGAIYAWTQRNTINKVAERESTKEVRAEVAEKTPPETSGDKEKIKKEK